MANREQKTLYTTVCYVVLLFCGLAVVSCAKKVTYPDKWPFAPGAVKVIYNGDSNLNLYDDQPHTLLVCVYQLDSPNSFNDLRKDVEGVEKLLECARFDDKVVSVDKIIVHPGEKNVFVFNRAEQSRYVGLVAGYYNLWPKSATRIFQVPLEESKVGGCNKYEANPAPLALKIYFGSDEIQHIWE